MNDRNRIDEAIETEGTYPRERARPRLRSEARRRSNARSAFEAEYNRPPTTPNTGWSESARSTGSVSPTSFDNPRLTGP